MNQQNQEQCRRILVIDDNHAIHDDFRKVLCPQISTQALDQLTAAMLGPSSDNSDVATYELDSAFQGQEGVDKVREALASEHPYALAFVDMRMPPGWDGIETIENLWRVDPHLQVAICTAYSDYSWEQTVARLGQTDRLLILKKPFDEVVVRQLACASVEKWNLQRTVEAQTAELRCVNQSLRKSVDRLQHEIAGRPSAEERLRHSAFHDSLTGLPNRALLLERLERCIKRSKRQNNFHFALLYLDLDNFKLVNDSMGHRTGDDLLCEISLQLRMAIRALDTAARPGDDTTARIGGDEFVVLLDGLAGPEDAVLVAQRIQKALSKPLMSTTCIGIVTNENSYDDPSEMLRDADIALYEAKAEGRGHYRIFNKDMHRRVVAKMELEHDLRSAIERRQLRLHYQPIISLESGVIVGFEALTRWIHPERGVIRPDEFIPLAEDTGLILSIGAWALDEACHQLRKWHQRFESYNQVSMSVNCSCKELADPDIIQRIDKAIEVTDIEPRMLKLEITETAIMEDTSGAKALLSEIRQRGIGIHLDDFGTGYSSLSYLHDLPLDAVKLDRLFVKDMSDDSKHTATVQAVVTLARTRGFEVIAEGVELLEQVAQLQTLNCDLAQGYFFSKPIAPEGIERMLGRGGDWRNANPVMLSNKLTSAV